MKHICSQVTYNQTAAENDNTPYGDPWQLIYVFDDNPNTNVVCEGYAKAFQYLCDLSEFTDTACYTVSGTMTGGTGAGPHMWNIVTLGGNNYLVDVTNCDGTSVGNTDQLFLKAPDPGGNVDTKYTFTIDTSNVVNYTYDEGQITLYGGDILTLAASDYDPNAESSGSAQVSLADAEVTVIGGPFTYSGTSQIPNVTVELGGVTLTPNTDYTLSYSNTNGGTGNTTNAGTITITVTGTGGYNGTKTATYAIGKATPNVGTVSYNGTAAILTSTNPNSVNLSRTDNTVDGTLTLAEDTVFTAGTNSYNWVFTPTDTSNYEMVTGQIQLTVTANEITNLSVGTPNRLNYQFGDTFNLSSVTVMVHYANGDSRTLGADELTVEYANGGNAFAMGETYVTLYYQGHSCRVTGLAVDKADYAGETMIQVSARYDDSTTVCTVDISQVLPQDYGEIISVSDGRSSGADIIGRFTGGSPAITYVVEEGLTEENLNDRAELTFVVSTANYNDISVVVEVALVRGYTITFLPNGGSGTILSLSLFEGMSLTLPACGFTAPSGYQFSHWAFNAPDGNEYNVGATFTGVGSDMTFYAVWELIPTPDTGGNTGSGGSSSGGGSSGGGSSTSTTDNGDGSTTTTVTRPNGTVTETTQHTDGSTTVVKTDRDGTVTTTETAADGSTSQVVEQPDGTVTTTQDDGEGNRSETVERADGTSQTTVSTASGAQSTTTVDASGHVEAQVSLPSQVSTASQIQGETVSMPMPSVTAARQSQTAPAVTITTNAPTPVQVEIPVERPTAGTVAVLVHPDGTEEIVKTSVTTGDGVVLSVEDGATVKIVDNSKSFSDVPASSWYSDAVDFASSRQLFSGTSDATFSPEVSMTRGMLTQVLYSLENSPESSASVTFTDVSGQDWYASAVNWAAGEGIVTGYEDGSFGANDIITREQLAVMLYRYAQSSGQDTTARSDLSGYADAGQVNGYAVQAMAWAHEEGLISGTSTTTLSPTASATRAQVATIFMRFCQGHFGT